MEISDYPEKYWHCSITTKGKGAEPSIINDVTLKYIYDDIIEPWHQKRPFTITGTIIHDTNDIKSIRIVQTNEPQKHYAQIYDAKMDASGIADMATDRRILPIEKGQDYTNEFLFKNAISTNPKIVSKGNKVFIVHGHVEKLKNEVARFIEKLSLEPIILHEQPNKGRTIIEKFEDYSDVSFAIVLLTSDDLGCTINQSKKLKSRARQNVIFELGFFIGKLKRQNVCALFDKDIELPSDYDGVVYIPIDENQGWKLQLARELKASEFNIDMNKLV